MEKSEPSFSVTVAAYYYPGFHRNSCFDAWKGEGFTEWDLVVNARPRFDGHEQPRLPVWGREDESDPLAMARKIDAAADHGVDAFIFDWYYHDEGPFLEGALDRGFLNASNNLRIRFGLMWANHDWYDIQGYNPADGDPRLLRRGKISPETWEKITDLAIWRYFPRPNYWMVDGKPWFSIYEMGLFLESFGSVEAGREALERFRSKVEAAGYSGLHLNAILWGCPNLPGGTTPADWPKLCGDLGLDSLTAYTWVHHDALSQGKFPTADYEGGRDKYLEFWKKAEKYPVPYFPNVTIGWDNSPRAHPEASWEKQRLHVVYPAIVGNSPGAFGEAFRVVRDRLLSLPVEPKIITINAWNEWPEGSMLEPDKKYGFGYLEALKSVARE